MGWHMVAYQPCYGRPCMAFEDERGDLVYRNCSCHVEERDGFCHYLQIPSTDICVILFAHSLREALGKAREWLDRHDIH